MRWASEHSSIISAVLDAQYIFRGCVVCSLLLASLIRSLVRAPRTFRAL